MARLIGPDEGSRLVQAIDSSKRFTSKAGRPAVFYSDANATALADILTYPGGVPIAGSSVMIDSNSMLPLIQYPAGVDTLWVVVDGGPAWPVYARADDRLDAVATQTADLGGRVTALEAVPGGGGPESVLTEVWTFSGTVETATGKMRFYNRTGREMVLQGAWISADTAPAAQALIADVNVNGVTVYTNQSNRPKLPVGLNAGPLSSAPDVTAVAGGDYLTVDIDQADGADVTVGVVYQLGDVSIPPPIGVPRHNLMPNPAAKNNVTGWGGGTPPTRVTGLVGLDRTTGARYTAGGFASLPAGAATPNVPYTVSMTARLDAGGAGFNPSTLYIVFHRSPGGDDFSHTVAVPSIAAGATVRLVATATAPANTDGVYLLWDGVSFDSVSTTLTAALYEQADAAGTYFDGDSAGATWDGADGNSASTL